MYIDSLVMVSIDLSETAQKAHWKSKKKSKNKNPRQILDKVKKKS